MGNVGKVVVHTQSHSWTLRGRTFGHKSRGEPVGALLWEHLEGHDIGSQVGLHPVFAGLRVNLNRFLRA